MVKHVLIFSLLFVLVCGGFVASVYFFMKPKQDSTDLAINTVQNGLNDQTNSSNSVDNQTLVEPLSGTEPLSKAIKRVTKKFFGTYVEPGKSPVSPEKFHGYHTGIDFEITPEEQKTDVPVFAVCTGAVALKEFGSGYGGVLSQHCTLNSKTNNGAKNNKTDVTIIYGHLRLSSIEVKSGDTLKQGQQFALLGTGYSKETDGERKHLHLGIHKGKGINLHGYVSTKNQLSDWLDPLLYIK